MSLRIHHRGLYANMILVTGASGKTGKVVIKSLSQVESVCAFVRDEKYIETLKSLGAEKVFIGDLEDKPALLSATQNIRAIYHICPNMNSEELAIGKLVIDSAIENGIEHFVYHSVLHPQIEVMNHHWQKMRVEEMIFESGIPFTILQPAPYMQNLLANWKSITKEGILRVPYSVEAKFSFLDLEDLAEVAKIVLTESNHKNAIYELAGTNPMSYTEVAEIFSKVLKREVKAERLEIGDWRLRTTGLSEYAMENLVRMFEYYDKHGLVGNPNVLKWVLKREPNSLENFIERMLKENNENS